MAKYNQVTLIGNLVANPTTRTFKTDKGERTVANYEIGVHTNDRTDFFRIASWGKQAENDAKYLQKGNMVMVQGDIQLGSYEKEDGTKVSTIQVNASSVTYLAPTSAKNTVAAASNEEEAEA